MDTGVSFDTRVHEQRPVATGCVPIFNLRYTNFESRQAYDEGQEYSGIFGINSGLNPVFCAKVFADGAVKCINISSYLCSL